jgi:hypothetical protein
MPDRKETEMESYVERWKREQEEAKQKEVQKDNGRRAEETRSKRKGQKAQKNRRVSEEQS